MDCTKKMLNNMKEKCTIFIHKFDKISKKQWFVFILIISFLMILLLNCFTPLIADDFNYSYGLNDKRIDSVSDIFKYQKHHYMTWTGRTVVHCIAQFFLMYPKWVFNIFNSLVYLLFIYLIYKHAVGKRNECRPSILLIIQLCLWFSLPVFGQDILWLVGSCNYLWGITIVLLFLLIYRFSLDEEKKLTVLKTILLSIFIFLFGVITGWTNENTVAALLAMLVMFAIYRLFLKKKLYMFHITGFIGVFIGFAIMILAPGNAIRSANFDSNMSFIRAIYTRFLNYTDYLINNFLPLIILFWILAVIGYFYGNFKNKKIVISAIYLAGSFLSIYSMLLSPTFPERAWIGPVTFLVIGICIAYNNLNFKTDLVRMLFIILVPTLTLCGLFSYCYATIDTRKIYFGWEKRKELIHQEVSKNNNFNIEVPRLNPVNSHVALYGLNDIQSDKHNWTNRAVSRYFKLDSIVSYE